MALPPDERRDRAKVNDAVRDAPEERRDSLIRGRPDASMQGAGPNRVEVLPKADAAVDRTHDPVAIA